MAEKPSRLGSEIQRVIDALSTDAATPALRTHKLHSKLAGYWACRAGADLRIVFEFAQHAGAEAIVLHALGTHDDVH